MIKELKTMPNTAHKNKLLFDFYQNIKNGTEVLSIEDVEVAIKTMELAKEQLRLKEQKRICEANVRANKKILNGKVLYLPKNQKTLYANAFRGNEEIVKVVLNEGLKEIGEYAFAGCTNLREVVFPKNRLVLRRGSFKECTSLTEIYIPDIANICPQAFMDCKSLEIVTLPGFVSHIYSEVFKNCLSLHTVNFEGQRPSCFYYGGVHFFPRVFQNCNSLEFIELPIGAVFDQKTFLNCKNLKEIYVNDKWRYPRKLEGCKAEIIFL